LLRYGSAVVSVALAAGARWLLDKPLGGFPFVTFFIAVLFTAWYGGLGPSLVALVLGFLVGAYCFVEPPGPFAVTGVAKPLRLGLYFFAGLCAGLFSEALRVARRRAQRATAAAEADRERLRVTLTSIGDAVLTTDAEGYVTFLNPVAEALTGWSG